MTAVKVGLAQINSRVGDLQANAAKILESARWASQQGVHLLITPELTLTGYPAEDLFLRDEFINSHDQGFERLCADLAAIDSGMHVVVGHIKRIDNKLYNVASVVCQGRVVACYCKHQLPDYGVFDEQRYFSPGHEPVVFDVNGLRFGINICEDAWLPESPAMAAQHGAQVLLVLNASPFTIHKQQQRHRQVGANVRGLATVYVNKVGGQDELVFDGASFVLDSHGNACAQFPVFQEAHGIIEFDENALPTSAGVSIANGPLQAAPQQWPNMLEQVYEALKLALTDYMHKSGFKKAVLALSGGMDSALVLAVAVDALGADKVRTLMMPSRYTADISLADAREMATGLGVAYDEILIGPLADGFDQALAPLFAGLQTDTTEENIQARIRGTLIMALSNKFGGLVITTGNKSELATGYCTLYGDMAGGFALLKDVPKTMVYDLARWRNERSPVIPQRIITRPPSAELRPDQTDQDSLPPYEILDAIIERYVEHNESAQQITQAGYDSQTVANVVRLIRISEYKRRQGAVGPKITSRAFGKDWRMPIANGYRQ